MFPILYEQITSGTVPQTKGLGTLSDCSSCIVEAERNGKYELIMEYPINGIHAQELAQRRVIKVKPNFTDDPQLFRIDRIGSVMNGKFTVYAKHISYDLSYFDISSGHANNAASACSLLQSAAPGYTITTNKEVTANFNINIPASVKSYFVGRQGSFLDVFGTAEIKYDNFRISFLTHAGQDRNVTIRYGKNLLELSQEGASSNLYSHVMCFYKKEDEAAIVGNKVSTGLTLDVNKTFILDVSSEYQEEPTTEQLTARAQEYINDNNLTVPSNNITLNFVQSGELANRVDLCDTVTVYYEALGISRTKVKCIRTKWDCIREKYIETEFGDVKQDLSTTIVENNAAIVQNKKDINNTYNLADHKRRVFVSHPTDTGITTPTPPYDEGDLWINGDDILYCVNSRTSGSYVETDWQKASDYVTETDFEEKMANTVRLITGGTGGNVIINYNETTGQPYEICISDTLDIHSNTAKVWRWNAGGLAYSAEGYDSQNFKAAINADGQIVADFIATGTLDASNVDIQNLTAKMFAGGEIRLGGTIDGKQMPEAILSLYDANNVLLARMDQNGLECFGEAVNGIRPSVVFDKYGVTGYSDSRPAYKANSKVFWVHNDEFHMKKCVAETEINACGKAKFVAVTITENGTVINDGLAVVATV